MWSSALVSALHMTGLALTLGSVFMRARYLRQPLDADGLKRLFIADSLWGIAAVIMLGTGALRAFGGLEKSSEYYLHSTFFMVKMGCFAGILGLEIWPMVTFIRWRRARPSDTSKARPFAVLSDIQTLLVLIMIFSASFMARGH